MTQNTLFDGEEGYIPERDDERLLKQLSRVRTLMSDGKWRTLDEIAAETKDPPASISARLRDLRKLKHGHRIVEKRHVERGLWSYRLVPKA